MAREDQGLKESRARYRVIPRTLCFVMHEGDVLLLRGGPHKRLWAGLYNGVGGHVEKGEDVYSAALREIHEETGLKVHDLRLRGVIHVDAGEPDLGILLFVFTATTDSRICTPSGEGELEWLSVASLPPPSEMVEDLPLLLPKVLSMTPTEPPFFASYRYDESNRLQILFAG